MSDRRASAANKRRTAEPGGQRAGRRDPSLTAESFEALRHLRQGVAAKRPWHLVLLEAVGMWTSPGEVLRGQERQYLVAGEAFDLLTLAQRLGEEVAEGIPQVEWRAFLVHGRFPQPVEEEDFRALLGSAKVKGLLNYWYGVALEGALQAAVRDEMRKERLSVGMRTQAGVADHAFRRIYGATRGLLLQQFRQAGSEEAVAVNGGGLAAKAGQSPKAFLYWLFKLRVRESEKARVASDTRKALLWLQRRRPEPLLTMMQGLALAEAEVGNGV
ncbi:MAG: hypothetical protein EXR48_04180 [Dehalococcoidia bacterium]|nr:hypothetical protein [Dehalococcoidia bacterium]